MTLPSILNEQLAAYKAEQKIERDIIAFSRYISRHNVGNSFHKNFKSREYRILAEGRIKRGVPFPSIITDESCWNLFIVLYNRLGGTPFIKVEKSPRSGTRYAYYAPYQCVRVSGHRCEGTSQQETHEFVGIPNVTEIKELINHIKTNNGTDI